MVPELLDHILINTFTLSQATNRLQVLKSLVLLRLFSSENTFSSEKNSIPHSKESSFVDKKEVAAPATTAIKTTGQETPWIVSLDPSIYAHFNRKNVYQAFEKLEAEIKKIKPLVVYLPFDIPEAQIREIGQKSRQLFGKNFLIDIKIDPSVITGTALVWNGVYKDYSIRQKLAQDRQRVLAMLKEFINKI